MYAVDPDMAGELAISAIEMVLTGQISSNDAMIDMLLAPAKAINDNNVQKYDQKKENSKAKKIKEMKLEEIAELVKRGAKQREIAERLKLSQQTVSYRIGLIRTTYPELLQNEEEMPIYKQNSDVYQNTNNFTKILQSHLQTGINQDMMPPVGMETAQTIYKENGFLPKNLQTNSDVYQNTKSTKSENLVILQEGEMFVKNEESFVKNGDSQQDPFFKF